MIGKFCGILVGIALTCFCAATGLFFLRGLGGCTLHRPGLSVARQRVQNVEDALSWYAIERRQCAPTSEDLVARGFVDPTSLVDPWGTHIAFRCSNESADATSAGPDRIFGTPDDVKGSEMERAR
jgi:hypothetical protein